MSRNVYFSQGVQSEKNLYEDIIIESIKIYGHEVFYMPRKIIQVDEILNEDVASRFDSAFNIEMYVENVDGYEGDGILMSKFGLEIRNQMKLVVSRKRWDASVGVWNAGYNNFRPSEGDLIYMPSVKGVFEIKFVELETPFYQLQNLPVYKITCELFEYSNEDIDTGVAEVDNLQRLKTQDQTTYRSTFTYQDVRAAMAATGTVNHLQVSDISGIYAGMAITSYQGAQPVTLTTINEIETPNESIPYYTIKWVPPGPPIATAAIPQLDKIYGFSYPVIAPIGMLADAVNPKNQPILRLATVAGLSVGMRVSDLSMGVYISIGTRIISVSTTDTTAKSITLSKNLLSDVPAGTKITFTAGFVIGETVKLSYPITVSATYPAGLNTVGDAEVLDVVEVTSIPGLTSLTPGASVAPLTASTLLVSNSNNSTRVTIKTPGPTLAAVAKAFPIAVGMILSGITYNTDNTTVATTQAIQAGSIITAIESVSTTVTTVVISRSLASAIDASYTTITVSPGLDNTILTLGTITFNDGIIHPLTSGVIVTSLKNSNTVSAKLADVITLVDDEDIADGDIQSQNSVLEIKGNDYLDFTEINPFGEPNDG